MNSEYAYYIIFNDVEWFFVFLILKWFNLNNVFILHCTYKLIYIHIYCVSYELIIWLSLITLKKEREGNPKGILTDFI